LEGNSFNRHRNMARRGELMAARQIHVHLIRITGLTNKLQVQPRRKLDLW